MAKINPYASYGSKVGVTGAKTVALPANYAFELTMDTWWSAVLRARTYSDFTGLDALYNYCMKSSTIIRSAVDKRLRPLKSRTFGVYIDGVENEELTQKLKDSPLMRKLVYQKGLANFTFARVVGVTKDLDTFIYPLRNLDVVNKAIKEETYDTIGKYNVDEHVNLFWLQTEYDSEDTLGLLEPISRDYINMVNSQNNWQTANNVLAYPQLMLYYENGDEKMVDKALEIAGRLGVGEVPISGKVTDQETGKVMKEFELESPYNGNAADTFRTFKENIEQLRAGIMQLVIGSSLLGMSDKNTNSERLVRAHLKMFRDICEADAIETQDWLNSGNVRVKLAYLLGIPELANATLRAKPSDYIDVGDIEVFVKMMKDLGIYPTDSFIRKSGLESEDVILMSNEDIEATGNDNESDGSTNKEASAKWTFSNVVARIAERVFRRKRPVNEEGLA